MISSAFFNHKYYFSMKNSIGIIVAILELFCLLFSTFLLFYAFFIDAGFRILPLFLLSTLSIVELSLAFVFPVDNINPNRFVVIIRSLFGYSAIINNDGIRNLAGLMFVVYMIHFVLFFVSSVKPTSFSSGGSVIAGSVVLILNAYLYFFKK
jgi:hypothetical protein